MENIKKQSVANKNVCRTTVVIPNYNGAKYIEACLDSVFAADSKVKVIVVDNASTDAGLQLLEDKYADRENFTLIPLDENTGFCHAVNVGIEEAGTEYVFLLNNDTTIERDCIRELEAVLDAEEKVFSACAKMICMYQPDKLDDAGDFYNALGWAFARGKDRPIESCEKQGRIFSCCAAGAMYRKEIFAEIGLFDEAHFAYLEDMDIGYRANIYGYRNLYVPKAVLYHAGSGVSGSRHNVFKVDLSARNNVYLIAKNMPLLQIVLNFPLLLIGFLVKFLFFVLKKMGKTYGVGVWKGLCLSFSKNGRKKRVRFKWKNFPNYLWIQWELWFGLIRRFF